LAGASLAGPARDATVRIIVEQRHGGNVARSPRLSAGAGPAPCIRAATPRRAATTFGLALAAVAMLAASGPGARGRHVSRPAAKAARTVVVIQDLDGGRQYSRIVDRQRPALDRLDGTVTSGETEARVAAFLEGGELRLIEEEALYGEPGEPGEPGGTGRNRYYVHDGRLVYFESLRIRPRDLGEGRLPARDEVLTALAFGEDGRSVGAEKTVNREPVPLAPTDEAGIRRRFLALAGVVQRSRAGEAGSR